MFGEVSFQKIEPNISSKRRPQKHKLLRTEIDHTFLPALNLLKISGKDQLPIPPQSQLLETHKLQVPQTLCDVLLHRFLLKFLMIQFYFGGLGEHIFGGVRSVMSEFVFASICIWLAGLEVDLTNVHLAPSSCSLLYLRWPVLPLDDLLLAFKRIHHIHRSLGL